MTVLDHEPERASTLRPLKGPDVRRLQLAVLERFDGYCRAHGLEYSLAYGTLLGAVRHEGYIPWDDDIDVMMARADFESLCRDFQDAPANRGLTLGHPDHGSDWPYPYAKISDDSTVLREAIDVEVPLGVNIDIFPIDALAVEALRRRLQVGALNLLRVLLVLRLILPRRGRGRARLTVVAVGKFAVRHLSPGRLAHNMTRLARAATATGTQPGVHHGVLVGPAHWSVPGEWLRPTDRVRFEGREYPAPVAYAQVLERLYGDFMRLPPPALQRSRHTFEAYRMDGTAPVASLVISAVPPQIVPAAAFSESERPRPTEGRRSRALGSLVDQVLSSGGNFVVLLAALHLLDLHGVGVYSFAYLFATFVLVAVRPMVLQALLVRFTVVADGERRVATGQAAGAALAIGLALTAIASCVSLAVPGGMRTTVLAWGILIPPMLVQDAWRHHFMAAGRQWAAALNDGICLIAALAFVLAVAAADMASPATLLLAWAAAASTGMVAGFFQIGTAPALRSTPRWFGSHRDLGVPLAVGTVVEQLASRLGLVAISVIAGAAALGQVTASMTVLMPMNTIISAGVTFAVPELVRRNKSRTAAGLDRLVVALSAGLALMIAAYVGVVALLPPSLGLVYAGQNWDESQFALLAVAAWIVTTALSQGPRAALQAYNAPRLVLRNSAVQGALQLSGAMIGAALGGAEGAAWGLAIGGGLSLVPWWISCWRVRDRRGG